MSVNFRQRLRAHPIALLADKASYTDDLSRASDQERERVPVELAHPNPRQALAEHIGAVVCFSLLKDGLMGSK